MKTRDFSLPWLEVGDIGVALPMHSFPVAPS
jgi:hypothetical protein